MYNAITPNASLKRLKTMTLWNATTAANLINNIRVLDDMRFKEYEGNVNSFI